MRSNIAHVSDTEILAQLKKIVSSRQLSSSTVLTDFLKFIVHETLEGREATLKEYTIGVQALRKESDFNPQLDGIVRIHAGRLRRALKEYYYEEGASDHLVISIPIGSYVPAFEVRDKVLVPPIDEGAEEHSQLLSESAQVNTSPVVEAVNTHDAKSSIYRPSISVLPFKNIGEAKVLDGIAMGLGELICTEMTQFEILKVISYYSGDHLLSQPSDIRGLGLLLDADYLLTGSVQFFHQVLQVNVQLNNRESGDQLWARRFEKHHALKDFWSFQDMVIDTIVASICGMNGVILRNELKKPDYLGPRAISWWYAKYVQNFDIHTLQEAKRFYENVVSADESNALAMSFLSEILAAESLLMGGCSELNEKGSLLAKFAIKTDPHCQQAYQSLAVHALMQGNEEYKRILYQGLERNPKSADYQGAMGALLIYGGELDKGIKILKKALQLNPFLPWWQLFSYSIYAYCKKLYSDALFWADKVERNIILIPVIKAASYAQLGLKQMARTLLDQIREQQPAINLYDPALLDKFFYSKAVVAEIKDGLDKAEMM